MTDDRHFLANAYLDGDLTPAERARAEADPVVMAEVARLRAVQAALRDVAPPAADVRAAMIAAAMAEFAGGAEAEPRVAAPVAPARPRRTSRWFEWQRGLSLAAAAVAVLAVGAVVVNGVNRGGDDDSIAATPEMAEADDAADRTRSSDASAGSAEIMIAADEAATDSIDAAGAEPPADLSMAAATMAPAAPGGAESSVGTFADTGRALTSLDELAALGQELLASADAAGPQAAFDDAECLAATGADADPATTGVYARALYRAAGADLPVLIAVDAATGQTLAIDPGPPCTLVAAVAP